MRCQTALLLLCLMSGACTSAGRAARDPGSPTPIADPRTGPAAVEGERPGNRGGEDVDRQMVPVRPAQAPLVGVGEALQIDSLLGRRVRVSGRCTARGEGRRAGSWTLDDAGASIEVRGLVPSSCDPERGEELTIFAQIEPKAPGSRDRLLLRLPD